ncbi:MAG: hypothetical protein HY884_09435 [Deltaproteobacteria bacterium]|nr:hypothetical protein [Deltaproteobacteria bacterium]
MSAALTALRTVVSKLSINGLCGALTLAALIATLTSANAAAQTAAKGAETDGLSFGIRNGFVSLTHSNGFHAKYTNGSYKLGSSYTGIYPFIRFISNERSALEIEYGKERGSGLTLQTVSLSGVHMLDYEKEKFKPYLKIGAVLGRVKWPELPGTVLTGTGWLAGAGAARAQGRVIYTADILYRSFKSAYVKGINNIGASEELDLSGFALKIGVMLKF